MGTSSTPSVVRRRVLIIDDNVDAAETLQELILEPHEVVLAHTGPAGVDKARSFRPDIVLCDIGLPGMDGYEVARAIRGILTGTVLIAISGSGREIDRALATEAGFDRFIPRPTTMHAVSELVALLLDPR